MGLRRLQALVHNLFRRSAVDRDLEAELAGYLELTADQARARGKSPEEAAREARLQLGGASGVTELVRSARTGAGVEQFWQDVSYAVRGLRRAPGYATLAILTLTFALGANVAIFSVVDAEMFKPLPYAHPEQLVEIIDVFNRGTADQRFQSGLTWSEVDRWRAEPSLFAAVTTYRGPERMTVGGGTWGGTSDVFLLSPDATDVLGMRPIMGRSFVEDDARNGRVVLLSEHFWRTAFAASRAVLGKPLTLDGRPYTIVGVMPETLRWRVGNSKVVAWLPRDEGAERRANRWPFTGAVARLHPGLTLDRAKADLRVAIDRLQSGKPPDRRWDADLLPLDIRALRNETLRRALAVLLGAVALVLFIACANVANLLLGRVVSRRRELAVRAALGATRRRLIRQVMTEGVVLAAAGGAAALLVGGLATRAIPSFVPDQLALFKANPPSIDGRTFVFGALAVMLTAVLCGVVPALRASRGDIMRSFEGGARVAGETPAGHQIRVWLQVCQVALTFVLLAGAGLLGVSFWRMVKTDPGYDIDRLASLSVMLPLERYPTDASQLAFFDALMQRLRGEPGLRAAYGSPPPGGYSGLLVPRGREAARLKSGSLSIYFVDANYFSIAGIPLKAGRLPSTEEVAARAPVGVLDERAAAVYWPGQSPIGQEFRYSPNDPWITVVGIVGHIKSRWFTSFDGTLQAYVPDSLNPSNQARSVLVRTEGDPLAAIAPLRATVQAIDPGLRLDDKIGRVSDMYEGVLVEPRFFMVLMALLAAVALLTASVGLYGVLSYSVAQRAREIGVRIALGADAAGIRRLVLGEALTPVAAGLAFGLVITLWLSKYLSSLLYETTPHDVSAFTGVSLFLLSVGAAAAFLPAHRATGVDPVETLRAD